MEHPKLFCWLETWKTLIGFNNNWLQLLRLCLQDLMVIDWLIDRWCRQADSVWALQLEYKEGTVYGTYPLGYMVGLGSTSTPVHWCSISNHRVLEPSTKSSAPASMKNPCLSWPLKMNLSRKLSWPYWPEYWGMGYGIMVVLYSSGDGGCR